MKARMSLWEKLWAEPLADTQSYWCNLIPPPPLHSAVYKRGRPRVTYSDAHTLRQTFTHTHNRAREGQRFEWVIQWETWQRWVCWKTVLPLFAGPLQKRQWSGVNLWTSCSSTNVRHILFMSLISYLYLYNGLVVLDVSDEFHWLGSDPQGWWLHCCIVLSMHAFSRLPALSHWMNGLLNVVNGSYSNPRWIES